MVGSGYDQLIPKAIGLRHGFVTCPAALKIGAGAQTMPSGSARLNPNTWSIGVMS